MSSIKLLLWSKIFSETNDSDKTVMLMTEGTPDEAHLAEAQAALRVPQINNGTPVYAEIATLTLSYGASPSNDDSIVITNGVITETYRFMDTPVLPTHIQTETSVTDALANAEILISAVSALVNAEEGTADLIFTAKSPGAAGNSITIAADFATGDGALTGGVDCTTAIKGDHYVDADYLYTAISDMDVTSTTGWAGSAITLLEDIV